MVVPSGMCQKAAVRDKTMHSALKYRYAAVTPHPLEIAMHAAAAKPLTPGCRRCAARPPV